MSFVIAALSIIGLVLVLYSLFLVWVPLVFFTAGLMFLRVAWNLDRSEE